MTYCPGFNQILGLRALPVPKLGTHIQRYRLEIGANSASVSSIDALFNQFIASVGGEPRQTVALEGMYSPHLNLIAASPTLCPPAGFPPYHKFTGVWHLASPAYVPPPELVAFLEEGPPPIIITFGVYGRLQWT